jgi:hydrogenase 3 maturation protease
MRTVVCGIGNRMRGDDAAGPMVIDELKKTPTGDVLLIDCGHSPEGFIKRILDFRPERLILVDTVDLKEKPGTFRRIGTGSIKKQALSTHKLPLTLMVNYLRSKTDFELVFLGVQPRHTGFDKPVSSECKRAVKDVSKAIKEMAR